MYTGSSRVKEILKSRKPWMVKKIRKKKMKLKSGFLKREVNKINKLLSSLARMKEKYQTLINNIRNNKHHYRPHRH